MLSIEVLLLIGFAVGCLIGFLLGEKKIGCWTMAVVPIGAISYVSWWQEQHPESIRSTSALDFMFVPIPPTFAALIGYGCVRFVRDWLALRGTK